MCFQVIYKDLNAVHEGMCRDLAKGGEWGMWSTESTLGWVGGICRWGIPSNLFVGFLMEVVKWLVESIALCWISSPGFCTPSLFQPLSCADHLSILGQERKKRVSWASFSLAGEARHWLSRLPFPYGRNCGSRGSFLAPWERGDLGNVKLFFLPSSMCQFSDFFFFGLIMWWNFSTGFPTKVFLLISGCQNCYSLGWGVGSHLG